MSPLLCCPNLGSLSRRQVLSSLFLPLFYPEKSQTEAQKIVLNKVNRKKRRKTISKKLSLKQGQQPIQRPRQKQTRAILRASKQITPMLLTMCVAFIVIPLPSNQVPSSKQVHLNADSNRITPQPLFLSPSSSTNQHPGEYSGTGSRKTQLGIWKIVHSREGKQRECFKSAL